MPLEAFLDRDVQSEIGLRDQRIVELEKKCREWERWYEGIVADFVGLTSDRADPNKTHDWEWMDGWRPAPSAIIVQMADET